MSPSIRDSKAEQPVRLDFALMKEDKKKSEERMLINFVSNKSLRLKISAISPMDPPDFKMRQYIGKRFVSVGVELTRVLNPDLKKFEAVQESIVRLAWEKFKRIYQDKLEVYVYYSRMPLPLKAAKVKSISDRLAKFVTDALERNAGAWFRIETKAVPGIPEIERILIYYDNDQDFENWQPHGAFVVPHIDEIWFSDIIRKKELKIPSYPEAFNKKWLVLVANFGHQSSHYQFSTLKKEFKQSPFDRIFVYKYREDEVIKVK